ncbi:MAG TPA: hemolysin family protein [Gemmatimonadales bacterium]|jgi:putative hemolysin|nr:hemolysin family protein [Gemmatimonadales bacterium]
MEPASPASPTFGITAVIVLVLANAFFVAAEFALVRSRMTRLDELVQNGDRKAILARRAIQSLARTISATQLGITLASLGLGWIGEPAIAAWIQDWFRALPPVIAGITTHTVATVIALALITYVTIILGELLPKAFALSHAETVAGWTAGPLLAFAWVMAGPIYLLKGTANWLLNRMGINPPGEQEQVHSPEEIRMLVEQSEEGGRLHKQDARLLEGVFEFSEKTAQEVMTPRTEMIALPAALSVEEAADEVARARRSRYPVFIESLDEIVGVVHAKDILSAIRSRPGETLRGIMRPPLFVPGTREVEDVLADMKRLKMHLAVVLDEYGGTAGLVTMEDLLEEIVGPIYDEYDPQERGQVAAPGGIVLDGAMPITEFNTEYDANLSDADYTTLGGFLFGQLGRLPKAGDRVVVGPLTFEILEMEGRRVKAIRLHQAKPQEAVND